MARKPLEAILTQALGWEGIIGEHMSSTQRAHRLEKKKGGKREFKEKKKRTGSINGGWSKQSLFLASCLGPRHGGVGKRTG